MKAALTAVFIFAGATGWTAPQDDRNSCIERMRSASFASYAQSVQACQSCLGGQPSQDQCATFGAGWCLSSGNCGKPGTGCEMVSGCSEAGGRPVDPDHRASGCGPGLVPGRSDSRSCFCAADVQQRYATQNAAQCGQLARRAALDGAQASDSQESDLALRRCENLRDQAQSCCDQPASCMNAADRRDERAAGPEGITAGSRQLRGRGDGNGRANISAGIACTRAYKSCVADCESSAAIHFASGVQGKMREAVARCEALSRNARMLGAQAVESMTASFSGQNTKGLSQAEDEHANDTMRAAGASEEEVRKASAGREAARADKAARFVDPNDPLRKRMVSSEELLSSSEEEWDEEGDEEPPLSGVPVFYRVAGRSANAGGSGGAPALKGAPSGATAVREGLVASPPEVPLSASLASMLNLKPSSNGGGAQRRLRTPSPVHLKDYLPGGVMDPRQKREPAAVSGSGDPAAAGRKMGIQSRHSDLFKAISQQMVRKCANGELWDCG